MVFGQLSHQITANCHIIFGSNRKIFLSDGQFILTGSAVPPKPRKDEEGNLIEEEQIHHTGTGRIVRLRLRTMTLWESEDSTGTVSLGELFENAEPVDGISHIDLDRLAYLTCRRGWPKAVLKKSEKACGHHMDGDVFAERQQTHPMSRRDGEGSVITFNPLELAALLDGLLGGGIDTTGGLGEGEGG